jgi:hypothetical protein
LQGEVVKVGSEAYKSDEKLLRLLRFTLLRHQAAQDFNARRFWATVDDRVADEIDRRILLLPAGFLEQLNRSLQPPDSSPG